MNILLKQELVGEISKWATYTVFNADTGEKLEKITAINLSLRHGELPNLTLSTIGDVTFKGQVNLEIIKEEKEKW